MTDAYLEPKESVSFGDIFDLSFMHDVHVRHDSVRLGVRALPEKAGGGVSYAPVFANPRWVLAHGDLSTSILITDNCLIDTALGQNRGGNARPNGRLLFAPVSAIKESELPLRTFGRFALPSWQGNWQAGAVELRRCFMVDARDIADNRERRQASLAADVADELEVRWSAFAARRGPLVSNRNCEKLAEVLMRQHGDEAPSDEDRHAARALAATLIHAWRLGGTALEAVSDAHANNTDGRQEIAELADVLRMLAEEAKAALALLEPSLD